MEGATAGVGAPFFLSRGDLDTKQEATEGAYRSFNDDLKSALSFFGPDPVGDFAQIEEDSDASSNEKIEFLLDYQSAITYDAIRQSNANATGKDADRIDYERRFYKAFLHDLFSWRLFMKRHYPIGAFQNLFDLGTVWDQIDRYQAQLEAWKDKAKNELNLKISGVRPPSTAADKPFFEQIPWGKLATAGVVAAAIIATPTLLSLLRTQKSASA